MEHDPVCGMKVEDTPKAISFVHEGKKYLFCTDLCKIQFEHNPEKYIKKDDDKNMHHHNHK